MEKVSHTFKLNDLVRHASDACPFIVTGITCDMVEIKGDWSGGVQPSNEKSWVSPKEIKLFSTSSDVEYDKLKRENIHNIDKWWSYEQEHILPCFKFAEKVGFDLQKAVMDNPGKNSTILLLEHLINLTKDIKSYDPAINSVPRFLTNIIKKIDDRIEYYTRTNISLHDTAVLATLNEVRLLISSETRL